MTEFPTESDFHAAFSKWLRSIGLLFVHSRMDRAATQQNGEPDYIIIRNRQCLGLELKQEKGRLSAAQVARHAEWAAAGTPVLITRTLDDACAVVRAWQATIGEATHIAGEPVAPKGRLVIRQRDTQGDWVMDRCGDVWLRRASVADVAALTRA